MTPLVLGPAIVPLVVDVEQAKREPELAVLSAIAHGKDRPEVAIELARAVFAACQLLDEERAVLYLDLVNASLGEIARIALEGLMIGKDYEFQSAYFRNRLAKGIAEGIAEGKAEGLAKGVVAGEARSILKFLLARGIVATAEQEQRIVSCAEVAVLDRWLERAVDELFEDGAPEQSSLPR